jgi:hypothetical protein
MYLSKPFSKAFSEAIEMYFYPRYPFYTSRKFYFFLQQTTFLRTSIDILDCIAGVA